MQYALQQVSILACLLTVVALIMRLKQDRGKLDTWGFIWTAGVSSLTVAYLQKTFVRIDGDPADMIDVWRELSLFVVISAKLFIGIKSEKSKPVS